VPCVLKRNGLAKAIVMGRAAVRSDSAMTPRNAPPDAWPEKLRIRNGARTFIVLPPLYRFEYQN
jgi:hypothetical protein